MAEDYTGVERRNCGDELRKAHEDVMDDLKGHIATLFDEFNLSKDFRGQARIAGIVALCIFTASFLYTYDHKQDTALKMAAQSAQNKERVQELKNDLTLKLNELNRDVDLNARDVGSIKGDLKVVEDRYSRLISDIEKVHNRLSQLVDVLAEEQRIQKVKLLESDDET